MCFTAIAMFAWTLLVSVTMMMMTKSGPDSDRVEYAEGSGLFTAIRKQLRMPSDVELVGADYTHHGGSAFELTSAQIKMHNEMRAAQDR